MSDSDDWRYRKAQERGLLGAGTIRRAPTTQSPAKLSPAPPKATQSPPRAVVPAMATMQPPRTAPPPLATGTAAPEKWRVTWLIAALGAMLLVGAAAGWLLKDATERVAPRATAIAAPPATDRVAEEPTIALPDGLPAATSLAVIGKPVDVSPKTEKSQPAPPAALNSKAAPPPTAPAFDPADTAKSVDAPDPATKVPRAAQPRRPIDASVRRALTPSFDCRRARTKVNRLICADARLADLDRRVSAAYRGALRRNGSAAEPQLDREHASFLNMRAACETSQCVARHTRWRLDDLDAN